MPSGQTRATVKANHGKDHHKGFNDALELALSQLSKDVGGVSGFAGHSATLEQTAPRAHL